MDIRNLSEAEYAELKRRKIKEIGYTPKPKERVIDARKMSSEQKAILRKLGWRRRTTW